MPVDDPVLASLVEEALAKNPEVMSARQLAVAASERPAQARSLPNPMLASVYTNDGWAPTLGSEEMTTLGFMVSQELPHSGKRELRGDIATREASQVQQQAERVARGITASVKRGYYGLVLSRQLLEHTQHQAEALQQIELIARTRYSLGQGAQQDVLRVQVEVTRIEQLLAEMQSEADIRLAELNRLLVRPPTAPLDTPANLQLRTVDTSLEQLVDWATGLSPEIKAAAFGAERATLAVALAKKDFKPDFSVQGAYMNRGTLAPMWQAGFGITLPIRRERLSAQLGEAEALLQSSQNDIESILLQLRFRTQERLTQLKTSERIATLYDQGILPQDRMSLEAAIANYQTGALPFIAVLEALTTLYIDGATHLRLVANHSVTIVNLEEASLEPSPAMAGGGATPSVGINISTAGGAGGMAKR
jgi:outer membrane protein TolC